jgi:flagellar basal-body rod protein FlgB
MGEIDDATIMSALRRQMTVMAARQVVAAGNLANVNTPGYKAREVTTFGDALDEQLASSARLAATSTGTHLEGNSRVDPGVTETRDLSARRDGNNVQMDRELLTMTKASADFAAAQTALAAKFRLVRYALTETR